MPAASATHAAPIHHRARLHHRHLFLPPQERHLTTDRLHCLVAGERSSDSIAAVCTTISFVPQLIRICRLNSAHEISLIMFLVFSLGVFLWLLYGIFIRSFPVILANAVSLVLSLAMLALKFRFDRK